MNNLRLLVVIGFVLVAFIGVIVKLFNVQVIKSEEYKIYAQRQQTAVQKIKAERGQIFDRNNVMLAYNKNDVSFYLDVRMPKKKDVDSLVKILSTIFNKPERHYRNIISSSKKIALLEKKAAGAKILPLKSLKINGFYFEEDPTRVYPYANLAAHTLGYMDASFTGVEGIEKVYEKELAGIDGRRFFIRDAKGNLITTIDEATQPAIKGNSAVLTINKTSQNILEEELQAGLEQFGGSYAVGIIMDPNTGEVLALSNKQDFNPNSYNTYNDEVRRNKALTDTYEPGSTFKTISMAIFIDKKVCNIGESVHGESGSYKYKNITIKDSHPEEMMTVKEVFSKSSNIGMAKLSHRINKEDFFLALRGFGFGNYSTFQLPGEAKGRLKKPTDWQEYGRSSISYGYDVAVTPIQLISAYAAVINGGVLFQPTIIKRIVDADGIVVNEFQPKEIRRVISSETSLMMREFLLSAVNEGTGKKAKIQNVNVGGKTGTSRKFIEGEYSTEFYNASFVGFFPVENPKYLMLILVNSPTKSIYGGEVAAPIFRNIAEKIIAIDESLWNKREVATTQNSKVVFTSEGNSDIENTGYHRGAANFDKTRMPDLINYSLRDAVRLLSTLNIEYEIFGSGKVISQNIAPGTRIYKKSICKIECSQNLNIETVLY